MHETDWGDDFWSAYRGKLQDQEHAALPPAEQAELGRKAKEEGQRRIRWHPEDAEWRKRADAAVERLARLGVEFTAEDIRREAGSPWHPNSFGGLFTTWARRGAIKRVGYRPSSRPRSRGGILAIWQGVEERADAS